ncbi:MAG TPA: GAF domain-containing protein, partial [Cyclobacteriaceae bacterium]|nr:GAF domain-containing protein [Cyclobacteriaceae bacterium]
MIKDWLNAQGWTVAGYALAVIIILNTAVLLYLNQLNHSAELAAKKATSALRYGKQLRESTIRADFAARDALREPTAYESAVTAFERARDSLTYNLKKAGLDPAIIGKLDVTASAIIRDHHGYLDAVHEPDSTGAVVGYSSAPSGFNAVARDLEILEAHLQEVAKRSSLSGLFGATLMLQFLLLASVPVLIALPRRFMKSKAKLLALNREIDDSNRKYVFDPLNHVDFENEQEIKSRLLANLRQAAEFIQQVSKGNYDVKWEGMDDTNRDANRDNIAGELIQMREQMKKVKREDEIRMWMTEGLSNFGGIIQKNQDNLQALGDAFISGLVKYLGAKIGGLFILEEREDNDSFLELHACYAYERKKYINKRVEIGEGLIGQTFLEGQTVYLREIPPDYLMISSSLGESAPRALVVVPLIVNNKTEGVLEMASLAEFPPHQIEFLEKVGESLAASLISARSSEKNKTLLQTSQQQAEEVRAQEEEMRQNMEELEATQEQMTRQMKELHKLREELEVEKYLFSALMDKVPEAIYFKDRDSKFLRVSKYLASHFGKEAEELIGKSDFDFQEEVHAREALEDEKIIMNTRTSKVDFIEKEVLKDGSEHYVSTTKMPLTDAHDNVVGTFGISRDVTRLKLDEIELR